MMLSLRKFELIIVLMIKKSHNCLKKYHYICHNLKKNEITNETD